MGRAEGSSELRHGGTKQRHPRHCATVKKAEVQRGLGAAHGHPAEAEPYALSSCHSTWWVRPHSLAKCNPCPSSKLMSLFYFYVWKHTRK